MVSNETVKKVWNGLTLMLESFTNPTQFPQYELLHLKTSAKTDFSRTLGEDTIEYKIRGTKNWEDEFKEGVGNTGWKMFRVKNSLVIKTTCSTFLHGQYRGCSSAPLYELYLLEDPNTEHLYIGVGTICTTAFQDDEFDDRKPCTIVRTCAPTIYVQDVFYETWKEHTFKCVNAFLGALAKQQELYNEYYAAWREYKKQKEHEEQRHLEVMTEMTNKIDALLNKTKKKASIVAESSGQGVHTAALERGDFEWIDKETHIL